MATVGAAWRQIQNDLEKGGINPAPREGKLFVAHVLGCEAADLIVREADIINPEGTITLENMFMRRMKYEPLAYILAKAPFWGRDWRVGPETLVPRPDSEILVRETLGILRGLKKRGSQLFDESAKKNPLRVCEVGLGSGALLGSVLSEELGVWGVGTDISAPALALGGINLRDAGLEGRFELLAGDVLEPTTGLFEVVFSNPPYIAEAEWAALEPGVKDFEPKLALAAGMDGLDIYRRLVPQAFGKLVPGGALLVEMGHTQAAVVSELFATAGFADIQTIPDLAGRDRVVIGHKKAV